MNKLIAIGWTGNRRCYLNVPREEAIKRYMQEHNIDKIANENMIEEIEFNDEFEVFDVWWWKNLT